MFHPEPNDPVQDQGYEENRHSPHDEYNQDLEPVNTQHCFPMFASVSRPDERIGETVASRRTTPELTGPARTVTPIATDQEERPMEPTDHSAPPATSITRTSISMTKPFSESLSVHVSRPAAPGIEDMLEDRVKAGPVMFSHPERVDLTQAPVADQVSFG